MLTLDRIRDEILELMKSCEANPERAQAGIQEIFYMLMCADQPFFLIYSEESPLLSPAASDEKNLYLRLFSHEEVAAKYSARTETNYKEHTLLDILQIGRWVFLGGAYGFILNEGDRWIRIPIPEFLSLFFTRIYGDASLCEQSCIEPVSLINEIRRNGFYHYGMKVDENGMWTGEVQPGLLPPLTVSSLFHVPTDILQVERDGVHCTYSRDTLQKALSLCGYMSDDASQLSGDSYENEPLILSPFADGKWRVDEPEHLALSFDLAIDPEFSEDSSSDNEQATEGFPVATAVINPPKKKIDLLAFIRNKLRIKPAEKKTSQKSESAILEPEASESESGPDSILESEGKPAEEPQPDIAAREDPPLEPVTETSQPDVAVREDPQAESSPDRDGSMSEETQETGKRKGRKKLWLALSAIFAIVLIVSGIFVIQHFQYKENLKIFRTYIAAQDYANAYVLYQDAKLGIEADGYLTDEVDGLVLRYANNEISAEELSASLKALSNFSTLSQELEIAKLTASKLEESKNAYVIGKESTDIYERLNTWRQVVQLDSVNYAAVQQTVEDNESRYVDVLRADIEYYRTRILDYAADRVDILAHWYPENEYIPALVKEFSSIQSVPLSYYPISVSNLRIQQEPNSYWTLYVQWSNLSVKTIKSICFSVVALGEDGKIITCEDAQGEWTIFDAMDKNMYEPGESPSFDRYYWNGAFYGPDVRAVRLTAVNIEYRDGSSASYTSDVDLDSITTR